MIQAARAILAWFGTLAAALALAACATAPRAPASAEQPAPAQATVDASYDWHGLVLMPFGTLLKESPLTLHEVLLFHDAEGASQPGRDCFTIDGAPPRLVGRTVQQYLLCFAHDRLDHIEASVPVEAAEAPAVFARACSLWLKTAAPQPAGERCEGRDGGVLFSAGLGQASAEAGQSDGALSLSLTLSDATDRGLPASAPEK